MVKFNLEDAKKGRPVVNGKGNRLVIVSFEGSNSEYPIVAVRKNKQRYDNFSYSTYNEKGESVANGSYHIDFLYHPIEIEESKTFPKRMNCLYEGKWSIKTVVFDATKLPNAPKLPVIALSKGGYDYFEKCEDVETTIMTLDEICEELGRNILIKK